MSAHYAIAKGVVDFNAEIAIKIVVSLVHGIAKCVIKLSALKQSLTIVHYVELKIA
jgi:hypothetical protein